MSEKESNINWKDNSDHIGRMLHEWRKSDALSDVTLFSDDKQQFKAHKLVLSACSPFFENIISDLKQRASVIYLEGIKDQDLSSILEFMYLGTTKVCQERIENFLSIAKNLELKGISLEDTINAAISQESDMDELNDITTTTDLTFENKSQDISVFLESEQYSLDVLTPISFEKKESDDFEFGTKRRDSLKSHKLAKHDDVGYKYKYECNMCDFVVTREYSLKVHIKSKHEKIQKYNCSKCEYQTGRKECLVNHIRTKHDGVKFFCNQCDYEAFHKCHLNRHIREKHEGFKYKCNKCDKEYGSEKGLEYHIQIIHEGLKLGGCCDKCDYLAPTKHMLKRHIDSVHEGITYDCKQCDYQCSTKETLIKHIEKKHKGNGHQNESGSNHKDRSLKKYTCDQCQFKGLSESNLKKHIQNKHVKKVVKYRYY